MRIGLTEGLVEVGVSSAFNVEVGKIREVYYRFSVIYLVALLAKRGLYIRHMLSNPSTNRVYVSRRNVQRRSGFTAIFKPLICEYKYDGACTNAQVRKTG